MQLTFVFPRDSVRFGADPFFSEQEKTLRAVGIQTGLCQSEPPFKPNKLPADAVVVFRNWMMTEKEYSCHLEALEAPAFTNLQAYLSCHHIPNWYPLLADLTFETQFFPLDADLTVETTALGWDQFILKDWVKSAKTESGVVVSTPQTVANDVELLKKQRDLEGGFCVRKFEQLNQSSEVRFFVINGRPHHPDKSKAVPEIVFETAGRIKTSKFFSVDIAMVAGSSDPARIVEIGDGQVSDLVGGWTAERFAEIWGKWR